MSFPVHLLSSTITLQIQFFGNLPSSFITLVLCAQIATSYLYFLYLHSNRYLRSSTCATKTERRDYFFFLINTRTNTQEKEIRLKYRDDTKNNLKGSCLRKIRLQSYIFPTVWNVGIESFETKEKEHEKGRQFKNKSSTLLKSHIHLNHHRWLVLHLHNKLLGNVKSLDTI